MSMEVTMLRTFTLALLTLALLGRPVWAHQYKGTVQSVDPRQPT